VPGQARAALLVTAVLGLLPLARGPGEAAPCAAPAERAARGAHSTAVGCAGGPALRGPARLLFGLPLDANTADAAALETLPGLGPARAAAIVAARCARPFRALEDLARVPGIGARTRERLAQWLAVDPGAAPACAPGGGPAAPQPARRG
jgi:competence protein ComEA